MIYEQLFLGDAPLIGLGQESVIAPTATTSTSPWTIALATSVVSAATSWMLEGAFRKARAK